MAEVHTRALTLEMEAPKYFGVGKAGVTKRAGTEGRAVIVEMNRG
jgi:hypothetical protein